MASPAATMFKIGRAKLAESPWRRASVRTVNAGNMSEKQALPDELHVTLAELAAPETWKRFTQAGVLQVTDFLPADTVASMAAAYADIYAAMVADQQFTTVGDERRKTPVPIAGPFCAPDLLAPPPLDAFLRQMLGDSYLLDSFTCVAALPGAPAQHVHKDFQLFGQPVDHFTPSYALHVFLPLVPLNEENGTTRFWLHSHRSPDAHNDASEGAGVYPQVPLGSAVLADYRVVHHGTANRSANTRPLLSLAYVRDWFVDSRNYPGVRPLVIGEAEWEAMDETLRLRLSRARPDRNLRLANYGSAY